MSKLLFGVALRINGDSFWLLFVTIFVTTAPIRVDFRCETLMPHLAQHLKLTLWLVCSSPCPAHAIHTLRHRLRRRRHAHSRTGPPGRGQALSRACVGVGPGHGTQSGDLTHRRHQAEFWSDSYRFVRNARRHSFEAALPTSATLRPSRRNHS